MLNHILHIFFHLSSLRQLNKACTSKNRISKPQYFDLSARRDAQRLVDLEKIRFFKKISKKACFSVIISAAGQDRTVGRDGDHLYRDRPSAVFYSLFYGVFNTAAAWNDHARHSDIFDLIIFQDLRQLF